MASRKKEWPPKGVDPKPNTSKGIKGSGAIVKRVDGDLKSIKPKDFAGVTNKTLKEDAKTKAGTGDGTYNGPAPRVGGKQKMVGKSGPLKSASKKVIRQSRRKPTGSPAARKSQRRNRR